MVSANSKLLDPVPDVVRRIFDETDLQATRKRQCVDGPGDAAGIVVPGRVIV